MASGIDGLIESIYLQDNIFKCSPESLKIWSMKQFGNLPLSKRLKELQWQSSDPLCASWWSNAHMFLKLKKINTAVQCCDPAFDIPLRNAVMDKGIFMCCTDSCSVLCQNHHYPSSKIDVFWADEGL